MQNNVNNFTKHKTELDSTMKNMKRQKWFIAVSVFILFNCKSFADETKLLRYPDAYKDKIVFCYSGDIYISSIDGKNAKQLTSFSGEEMLPKFSSDGEQIAFTAEFEGNKEIYVMSANGGMPKRLTFHPADEYVVDWHTDGTKILFRSNGSSNSYRYNRLHAVSAKGGLPVVLELPEADLSSYNDNGKKIAFCRTSTETLIWKGYRGGAAPKIWIYDFVNKKAEMVIDDNSINHHPMWIGENIYFLSDRGKNAEQNLWVYNSKKKNTRQLTFYKNWSVKWPSKSEDKIIFENEGRLCLYNIHDGKTNNINIDIVLPNNYLSVAVKNVQNKVSSPTITPDGKKVILCARGDLFYLDPEKSITRNITQTSGVNERFPVFSPEGHYFAYISDVSGEEQVYIQPEDLTQKPIQVSNNVKSKLGKLNWSPDGKKIGYSDKRASYYVIDIETKETKKIFFDKYFASERFVSASWSPDSKWLVYTSGNPSWNYSIYLYSLENDKSYRVTDEYVHTNEPQFDPDGKYLYWIADCKVNIEDSYWDNEHHMVNPSKIVIATLQKDLISPFAPVQPGDSKEQGKTTFPIKIDIEGLGSRISVVPVEDSNYSSLLALKGKLIYQSSPAGGESAIKMFDIAEKKETVLLKDAYYCIPAANANKIVYLAAGMVGILDIKSDQKAGEGLINLSGLKMTINYKKEWAQIFNEAWRVQRDFFFDENLGGVNWEAVRKKYESLLPYVASRMDLNYLMADLLAELRHSHVEISGGDLPKIPQNKIGLLGIDLEWDINNKLYKISKILKGQNWDDEKYSPVTLPGMNIKEGNFLLAIDGVTLKKDFNPDSLLVDKAGEIVSLTINDKPTFADSRKVNVKAAAYSKDQGNLLRYNDWVLNNIEKVNKASGGKVGYIHIPDTYIPGIESFFRYFYPQTNKEGLILDIRFNSGGYSPYWMIERLNRVMFCYSHFPYGKAPMKEPDSGFFGVKVCIANEWVESGGENFSSIFKKLNSGLVIGKRTSGNLASARGFALLDGGIVTYPAEGKYNSKGESFVENIGVSPDIDITNRPDDMINGKDLQLERSIIEIMKQLKVKVK
ncbi:MAG: hypothetical protein C0412_04250 [Flavobacterium sp.]|nr:hypothetical protein [Flavobacterium sp.]